MLAACGGGESAHASPPGLVAIDGGAGVADAAAGGDGSSPSGCADGIEGCPCSELGKRVFCGWINIRSGTYVACSPGEAVCLEGLTWGSCNPTAESHVVYPPHR
jgi:hypothetical protein